MSSIRCAQQAREYGISPLGTAGSYTGYLLVSWPLPWPAAMGDVPLLGEIQVVLEGTGIRLQAIVGEPGTATLYRRSDSDWFTCYERSEGSVSTAEDVVSLLQGAVGEPATRSVADFLVCTHGRHDICCGSQGTSLAGRLGATPAFARTDLILRRTSHLGGHRYAPTGLFLPDGTVWAFLDDDAVERIIERRGPVDDLLPRYRGSSGIGPEAAQILEAVAFGEVGWEWLDWRRRAHVEDGLATIEAEEPSGVRHSWRAEVLDGQPTPVPVCGKQMDDCKWRKAPTLATVTRA